MITKQEIVTQILLPARAKHWKSVNSYCGYAWAPSNLALCKYWGKRDIELNLPITPSISISLGNKGAYTSIKQQESLMQDHIVLNGKEIASNDLFAKRLSKFLDLFRPHPNIYYSIETVSTIPIASGLASSACGYAALVKALDCLYGWRLGKKELSILARLGSGSASRSLWNGFVEWHMGKDINGMDSYSQPLSYIWNDLRIGLLIVSNLPKAISSTKAMQHTVETSLFYSNWTKVVERDFSAIKNALANNDFMLLGKTAECNALAMHAVSAAAYPPIFYHQPETIAAMHRVWDLRNAKIPVFFSQDAGANLQLLFLSSEEKILKQAFPELEIIRPFSDIVEDKNTEHLILVNDRDIEIGADEKISVHINGKLHRAFSVFIVQKINSKITLLLQQRSAKKYHSPNLWSNACCGHPRVGENIIDAAKRRLQEEMGFKADLQEIGSFHYKAIFTNGMVENEIDHVLFGVMNNNIVCANNEEIQNYQFVGLEELLLDLECNPSKYTVWLKQALQILLNTI